MSIPRTTPDTPNRTRLPLATTCRRIVGAGALAVSLLGLTGPAAHAGQDQQIVTKGGYVRFAAHGEVLAAADTTADGYAVRAELYWAGGRAYIADFGFQDGAERKVNLSIREGTDVKLRMCYITEGRPVHCSHMQSAVA